VTTAYCACQKLPPGLCLVCRSAHKFLFSLCAWLAKVLLDRIALHPFWEFAVRTAKSVLALLSVIGRISVATRQFVRSYRPSYTEVAGGSAGLVPGAEVASGGKTASGSKVYIYRHPLLLR
jgi:hypothetical protein